MTATPVIQRVEPGDIVHTSGRHLGDAGRTGEILAVLGEDEHPHYRVRWEDGRETVFYPREGTTIVSHEAEVCWAD